MTRFIIIRHGLSVYNEARRFQGHLDIPLHAIGLEQADASAKYVLENYKIDRVYSSDLCRASRTAQPIADGLGLPLELDKRLREDVDLSETEFIEDPTVYGEGEKEIVRRKTYPVRPMSPEDAALQMELLGHSFFVYLDSETQQTHVVYRRADGKYGLMMPE